MSFLNPHPAVLPAQPQSLYFAYGSNLHLQQMAKRCPESQFQGRARLHNFRWQINERGFANVVPDPNSSVEGLCYLLSSEDEARLDRSEGVPTAYQKKWTEVEFYPAAAKMLGRKVIEILRFDLMVREGRQPMAQSSVQHIESGDVGTQYGAQDAVGNTNLARDVTEITYFRRGGRTHAVEKTGTSHRRGQSVPASNRNHIKARTSFNLTGSTHGEPARVLVYLSQNHVKEGLPWDEYVERMNWGIIDALDLGISRQYIEQVISPFLERAMGYHANGKPRGRGVREKKKRRHVTLKKQQRSEETKNSSDQHSEQPLREIEPNNWETTEQNHYEYHDYRGS